MSEQKPGITLKDLALAVQVIDTVTQRGAIRGEEMESVGQLRNRIVAFLKASEAEMQEAEEADAPAEEAPVEEPKTVIDAEVLED